MPKPNSRMPLWRKLALQAVPLVLASCSWWIVTTVGSAVDHDVTVSVHLR
jgi:hypothetical protein